MNNSTFGNDFIQLNRLLNWAEAPTEWNPAIKSMDGFLGYVYDLLTNKDIENKWSETDFARALAVLLTILSETGQYQFEAFVPNPEKDSDKAKRKIVDDNLMPAMALLRHRAADVTKTYLSRPIFEFIKNQLKKRFFH